MAVERTHISFTVEGSNYEALRSAAKAALIDLLGKDLAENLSFAITVNEDVTTQGGTRISWRASVDATLLLS